MRDGDIPLRLHGHTLVLNWNSLTLSLLRQLHHAQHDPKHCLYKRPVVVLAGAGLCACCTLAWILGSVASTADHL